MREHIPLTHGIGDSPQKPNIKVDLQVWRTLFYLSSLSYELLKWYWLKYQRLPDLHQGSRLSIFSLSMQVQNQRPESLEPSPKSVRNMTLTERKWLWYIMWNCDIVCTYHMILKFLIWMVISRHVIFVNKNRQQSII